MKITKTKGFSLVELMIVIAIIGIVAAIASLAWQRAAANTNLQTAARELAADMANTKHRAVAEDVCYRMTITAGIPGTYTIEQGNAACCSTIACPSDMYNTAGTPGTIFTVIRTKSPTDGDKGAGLSINGANNIITFSPRGTSSPGNVVLQNSRGSTATIITNFTGKTYVTFNFI